jgi:hypothetical protein
MMSAGQHGGHPLADANLPAVAIATAIAAITSPSGVPARSGNTGTERQIDEQRGERRPPQLRVTPGPPRPARPVPAG